MRIAYDWRADSLSVVLKERGHSERRAMGEPGGDQAWVRWRGAETYEENARVRPMNNPYNYVIGDAFI